MFQVGGPILYFFLFVFGISFDLTPNAIHVRGRLAETFLEKGLEFVLFEVIVPFSPDPSLMLLPAKVDLIAEEKGRKRYAFVAFSISRLEIVFTLTNEIVTFHLRVSIV